MPTTTNSDDGQLVTTVYDDGTIAVQFTPTPGSPAANQQTLQSKAQAALAANANDIAQNANIATTANSVPASGTFSTTQLSTYVRQLAQAVATLAANDTNAKKELNAVIRLLLGQLDTTADT